MMRFRSFMVRYQLANIRLLQMKDAQIAQKSHTSVLAPKLDRLRIVCGFKKSLLTFSLVFVIPVIYITYALNKCTVTIEHKTTTGFHRKDVDQLVY